MIKETLIWCKQSALSKMLENVSKDDCFLVLVIVSFLICAKGQLHILARASIGRRSQTRHR